MSQEVESAQPSLEAARPLRQSERHDAITELVLSAGSMRIEDLAGQFDVSIMTIHRDLDILSDRGIVRKSRGFVTAVASSLFEANQEYRQRQNTADKEAVSKAAVAFVEPGQVLILDDSTTGLHLAKLFHERQPLTVITNFQRAIDALVDQPGIAVISLGGQLYHWCDAFMGSITVNSLRSLRADALFMSTPSIIDDICFHQHHDAALIKRAMFDSAEKRYLLVDHSKFEQRALHANIALEEFDAVIVDSQTPNVHVKRLRDKGVKVIVADE
jgi:DeoR/GlpR family transcriptional regulator of sugar metabolism